MPPTRPAFSWAKSSPHRRIAGGLSPRRPRRYGRLAEAQQRPPALLRLNRLTLPPRLMSVDLVAREMFDVPLRSHVDDRREKRKALNPGAFNERPGTRWKRGTDVALDR